MAEETGEILGRAAAGDREALEQLFQRHRERLLRLVRYRMDPRLRGRVDASDIIQETWLEAYRRFEKYVGDQKMPFFLWLRFLTSQKIMELHRHHLGAQRRDVRREVRLHRGPWPEATTTVLAAQLLGKATAPDRAAERAEQRLQLEQALNSMDRLDCEVLVLRHFEQLTNAETASELGIETSAASKRYIRAIRKLKGLMDSMGFEL